MVGIAAASQLKMQIQKHLPGSEMHTLALRHKRAVRLAQLQDVLGGWDEDKPKDALA